MARRQLDTADAIEVIASQHLVRVAFRDGLASYLIPLGYTWLAPALCGVADSGRKIHLAQQDPVVAFQVDTSAETGLFEWQSVTGTGEFRVVTEAEERQAVLAALAPVLDRAPSWWRREQAPAMATGKTLVWKLTPQDLSGCEYVRPQ